MSDTLLLDDSKKLQSEIQQKHCDLFQERKGYPPLRVSRVSIENVEPIGEKIRIERDKEVWEITDFTSSNKTFVEIYVISQKRSWTTLDISRDMFEAFISRNMVFSQVWKSMASFGRKSKENEFEFPGFRARRTQSISCGNSVAYESSYVLRRVELNGRSTIGGQSPWSIRQTAIYHRFERDWDNTQTSDAAGKSLFLLIAPSQNAEENVAKYLEASSISSSKILTWNIQRLLIEDSLSGWIPYMASLEKRLKEQSDAIVVAEVGTTDKLSPLTNFEINFSDRQVLKILEDEIIALSTILPNNLEIIARTREQLKKCCKRKQLNRNEKAYFDMIVEEFDEYIHEAKMLIHRARVLRESAQSTSQLLSDLLNYEEAIALKELTKGSQEENTSMRYLAERTTKDAAAVKILTVIALIYLPSTIVENFFSTEFVQTNENGHMRVTENGWLLVAIAVPLTIFTLGLWWAWVHYFVQVTIPESSVDTADSPLVKKKTGLWPKILLRIHKTQPHKDVEQGVCLPPNVIFQPCSVHAEATPTWSTDATTVKPE